MSTQHTPGPWRLEEVSDDAGRIKHLCPVGTDDLSLLTIVEHDGVKFAAVYSDADARLIAAAPLLLEALQELRYACTDKAEAMADAAIAAATGSPR